MDKPIYLCERCEKTMDKIDLMHSKSMCKDCRNKLLAELYQENNSSSTGKDNAKRSA